MSTETRPETAGLAEALCNPMCHHEGAYRECDKYAEVALSWLTARLTDDDVVEAAARAVSRTIWGSDTAKDEWTREARAALAAAAAVIGGGSDE